MTRYVVEAHFAEGLQVPVTNKGATACLSVVETNAVDGMTWLHSYVTVDKLKTFCVYDAHNREAIGTTAALNGLPVDNISEVRVLDPYFYT